MAELRPNATSQVINHNYSIEPTAHLQRCTGQEEPYDNQPTVSLIPTATVSALTKHSFPLMKLPTELRLLVYEYYYGNIEPGIRLKSNIAGQPVKCRGIPNLAIELVSRTVGAEAKMIREERLSSTLRIGIANSRLVGFRCFAEHPKFKYLRDRIVKINVTQSEATFYNFNWDLVLKNCPQMRFLNISFHGDLFGSFGRIFNWGRRTQIQIANVEPPFPIEIDEYCRFFTRMDERTSKKCGIQIKYIDTWSSAESRYNNVVSSWKHSHHTFITIANAKQRFTYNVTSTASELIARECTVGIIRVFLQKGLDTPMCEKEGEVPQPMKKITVSGRQKWTLPWLSAGELWLRP